MQEITRKMTEREIKAVAEYLAGVKEKQAAGREK
jgi:hypothetical protein